MKTPFRNLLAIACAFVAFTPSGCISPQEASLPIEQTRVFALTRFVVYAGSSTLLRQQPQQRAILERSKAGLDSLVASAKWDVAAVGQALVMAGVTQAQTPEATLIVAGVTLLTDVWLHKQVDLGSNRTAEAYVRGATEGLTTALTEPAVATRSGPGGSSTFERLRKDAEATRP